MSDSEHKENCQERRYEEEFDRIDSGEELCELDAAMRRWAETKKLVPNEHGAFDYCTCGLYPDDVPD